MLASNLCPSLTYFWYQGFIFNSAYSILTLFTNFMINIKQVQSFRLCLLLLSSTYIHVRTEFSLFMLGSKKNYRIATANVMTKHRLDCFASNSFKKTRRSWTLLSFLDCSNEWRLTFENYNSCYRNLGCLFSDSC